MHDLALAAMIDHTLLDPLATDEQINDLTRRRSGTFEGIGWNTNARPCPAHDRGCAERLGTSSGVAILRTTQPPGST
jgi:deoxyribose-phosphate aldolase